jgi:hypothetical protein
MASRPFVPILSWIASELSAFLSPSWSFRRSFPGGASTKSGLGRLLAEDCHCCSRRTLILRFALVEMAAGQLGSSSGTHCWAQESWKRARGAGSDTVGVGGRGLLAVCLFLGALGCLGHVLVQLRNCLTLKMPSPITLSIPDSANLNQKRACLPSMWRDRGATPTSAWRLCNGVAL